jgi:hypothetical protein
MISIIIEELFLALAEDLADILSVNSAADASNAISEML